MGKICGDGFQRQRFAEEKEKGVLDLEISETTVGVCQGQRWRKIPNMYNLKSLAEYDLSTSDIWKFAQVNARWVLAVETVNPQARGGQDDVGGGPAFISCSCTKGEKLGSI
uniref:Uncharacterized protein n=1 Tax=Compsopogon caeruleus TaxID=31354 RepID=A0A7S1TGK9_9RHOD|mmetsp:Transcript_3067/g.5909  ORF Transcript_3067/g.5909 Transcript_3067/m.5909 type:complete len:111 (+) Transcript_3067:271-603(+)